MWAKSPSIINCLSACLSLFLVIPWTEGFWYEVLLFTGNRHVESGSWGQEAAEENAKMRARKLKREWVGEGAGRGTEKALEELCDGN